MRENAIGTESREKSKIQDGTDKESNHSFSSNAQKAKAEPTTNGSTANKANHRDSGLRRSEINFGEDEFFITNWQDDSYKSYYVTRQCFECRPENPIFV